MKYDKIKKLDDEYYKKSKPSAAEPELEPMRRPPRRLSQPQVQMSASGKGLKMVTDNKKTAIIVVLSVITALSLTLAGVVVLKYRTPAAKSPDKQLLPENIEKSRDILAGIFKIGGNGPENPDEWKDILGTNGEESSESEQGETKTSKGTSEPIPDDIKEKMKGATNRGNPDESFENLAYLTIPYKNFKGEDDEGHMVVDKELADEVLNIFSELYEIGYPIEKMEIMDIYMDDSMKDNHQLDEKSMQENNTASYCYRKVIGTDNISSHAYGRAIDVNPKINPWVRGKSIHPSNAEVYAKRTLNKADMPSWVGWKNAEREAFIGPDTEVYKIFTKYGWEWGGKWKNSDYQHFFKDK